MQDPAATAAVYEAATRLLIGNHLPVTIGIAVSNSTTEARTRRLSWRPQRTPMRLILLFQTVILSVAALAADQPQWGEAWTRNLVSSEKGLPSSWDLETGRNVRWV